MEDVEREHARLRVVLAKIDDQLSAKTSDAALPGDRYERQRVSLLEAEARIAAAQATIRTAGVL